MIASERPQNFIIIAMIITTVISSGFIIGNAQYYGGSYILAGQLEVNLVDIQVSNVNTTDETEDPSLVLSFNLAIPAQADGNVRITFFGATVWLNNDLLSLTSFSLTPALADQYLYSNFDRNIAMSQTASSTSDRQTIIDAYLTSSWTWNVTLRYSFIVFDEPNTIMWRWFEFYTTDFTLT
ncbi:MAG: hypothetical protein ACFFCT_00320 [Candidatus Odinarchaeota archaeon]